MESALCPIGRGPFAIAFSISAAALAQDTKTDADTGLVLDEAFVLVKGQCTGCHSDQLITHSGKTREGWIDSIRWMQRNQGLGALGSTEEPIVSYLAKHYPVDVMICRRRPLGTDRILLWHRSLSDS